MSRRRPGSVWVILLGLLWLAACGSLQVGWEPAGTAAPPTPDRLRTQIHTATVLRLTGAASATAPPSTDQATLAAPTAVLPEITATAIAAATAVAAVTEPPQTPSVFSQAATPGQVIALTSIPSSPTPDLPQPTAPASTATSEPAGPRILRFEAQRRVDDRGQDEVELTWEAVGGQVSACPLLDTLALTAGCFYDLPASGSRVVRSDEIVANYTGFQLVVNDAGSVAVREAGVTVLCPTFDTWFFANRPPVCPRDGPLASSAAVQRFEHGRLIWVEALDTFYMLLDGQPGRLTPVPGPLALEPGASPDNRIGETPPEGLFEPVSGFGLLWRGEVSGVDGVREALGWAVAPEAGFQTLYQCELIVGPTQSCYLRSPEGQTLNFYYMRYFGYYWTVR